MTTKMKMTKRAARAWVKEQVRLIGAGFHPDTNGHDYTDQYGRRTMDDTAAKLFEECRAAAFASGADLYEAGLDELHKPISPGGDQTLRLYGWVRVGYTNDYRHEGMPGHTITLRGYTTSHRPALLFSHTWPDQSTDPYELAGMEALSYRLMTLERKRTAAGGKP